MTRKETSCAPIAILQHPLNINVPQTKMNMATNYSKSQLARLLVPQLKEQLQQLGLSTTGEYIIHLRSRKCLIDEILL